MDRNSILKSHTPRLVPFEVPEWDGTIYLRPLTAAQRDRYESELAKALPKDSAGKPIPGSLPTYHRVPLVMLCVCDVEGKRIFRDEDESALKEMPWDVIDKVYTQCAKLSGLIGDDDAKKD